MTVKQPKPDYRFAAWLGKQIKLTRLISEDEQWKAVTEIRTLDEVMGYGIRIDKKIFVPWGKVEQLEVDLNG
jgi:hypothetical protein